MRLFEIITKSKDWTKISTTADGYMGWIQNGQFLTVDSQLYQHYQSLSITRVGFEEAFLGIVIMLFSFYMELMLEHLLLILMRIIYKSLLARNCDTAQ